MQWKLIGFITVLIFILSFISFNLDNKCDIHLGFTNQEDVPVYLTIFVSFIAGLISALLLIFCFKKKPKTPLPKDKKFKPKKEETPAPFKANPDGGFNA